jgi:hypothetical protein
MRSTVPVVEARGAGAASAATPVPSRAHALQAATRRVRRGDLDVGPKLTTDLSTGVTTGRTLDGHRANVCPVRPYHGPGRPAMSGKYLAGKWFSQT